MYKIVECHPLVEYRTSKKCGNKRDDATQPGSGNIVKVAATMTQKEASICEDYDRGDIGTRRYGRGTDMAGQGWQQPEQNVDLRKMEVTLAGKTYMRQAQLDDF